MALSKQWTRGATLAGLLFAAACGDDSGSVNRPAATSDAGSGGGGGGLGAGILGKACTSASDCGNGGTCASVQTFGMLSTLLSLVGVQVLRAPYGYCTRTCSTDADCGADGVCLGALAGFLLGECRKSCSSNADCREHYECAQQSQAAADAGTPNPAALLRLPSQCQAKPTPNVLADNQAGAPCGQSADGGVLSCGEGYCSANGCTGICTEDSTCGKGGTCVQNGFYGSAGVCAQTCSVDTDCHSYTAEGSIGCVASADGRKLCTLKQFPLEPNVVGTACSVATSTSPALGCGAHGECSASLGNAEAAGGYCTLTGCADDSVCGGGVCIVSGLTSRCYAACTSDASCRPDYSCVERPAVTSMTTAKVCAPTPVVIDGGSVRPSDASDAGMLQSLDAATVDAG